MTDDEYCDAFVKARRVRDEAILLLLNRAISERSKISWGKVEFDAGILPERNDSFSALVNGVAENDRRQPQPAFRIRAKVAVEDSGQGLELSVICDYTNFHPGSINKSKELHQSPKCSVSVADFRLDTIREWYSKQFNECLEKCNVIL